MSDDERNSPEKPSDEPAKESSSSNEPAEKDNDEQNQTETETPTDAEKDKPTSTEDSEKDDKKDSDKDSKDAKDESDSTKYIRLRVVGNHDVHGINFRLKYTTALCKLKKSYSNHVGIPTGNLRFLFDGRRISDEDTPKQLDMSDDDQIEVYHEQTGGMDL